MIITKLMYLMSRNMLMVMVYFSQLLPLPLSRYIIVISRQIMASDTSFLYSQHHQLFDFVCTAYICTYVCNVFFCRCFSCMCVCKAYMVQHMH